MNRALKVLVPMFAVVLVACNGSRVSADTIVLCPTAVTAVGGTVGYDFAITIQNYDTGNGSNTSVVVGTGLAPASYPDGATDNAGYMGRFAGSIGSLVYTVPTTLAPALPGYTAPTITGIELWQYCELYNSTYYNNRGLNSVTVSYSTDGGTTWKNPQTLTFTQASPSADVPAQFRPLSGLPTGVNAIELTGLSNFGGTAGYCGFGEIRFVGTANTVPEPASIVLLATGLIGLLAYAWRKRRS